MCEKLLAYRRGLLARSPGKLQDTSEQAERRFWEEEKMAVYATWQDGQKDDLS